MTGRLECSGTSRSEFHAPVIPAGCKRKSSDMARQRDFSTGEAQLADQGVRRPGAEARDYLSANGRRVGEASW